MEAQVGVSSHGGAVVDRKFLQSHHHHHQPPPAVHQRNQIGTVPHLLAGGIAGAFSKTCTTPLARLTILFQVQGMHSDAAALSKAGIWHEALRIVNEEGFRAFWKGNQVTIAHRLPYSSINFYTYEHYKSVLKSIPGLESYRRSTSADIFVHFVGGGLAGMTAASATYPLDLVRTRLAAQRSTMYYQGLWHALHTICRDEGFFGLYKGLGATLLGVGPSIAISFSVYEALRSHWHSQKCALLVLCINKAPFLVPSYICLLLGVLLHMISDILTSLIRPDDSTAVVSLACGSLSGIASSTATFPLDLVRRRKQLEGVAGQARVYNTGIYGTFKHIMRTEGLGGLYRGILPEYYKVVPGVGIVFMTYETLKKVLSHGPFDS